MSVKPEVHAGGPGGPLAPSREITANDEDVRLVEGLLAGDPEAPTVLWRRYAPLVRQILRRSFGPEWDVEDLVQVTFLTFFERLPTLKKPESLRAFLTSITVFTARGELRSRWVRRGVRLSSGESLPEQEAPGTDPIVRATLLRFYAILDQLRALDRTVFVLRFFEEMTVAEVAEAAGVSTGTVKRRLASAWKRISRCMERDPLLVEYLDQLERKGAS